MQKVIANRTCRDVINRSAIILSQLSLNSIQCNLLFIFDKNKKGEKRISASKIWRFWLNRKTYIRVWGQWLRGSAVRAVCGITLCSIILQKQNIVENINKNEILKIQFWFSNYSAGSSFPFLLSDSLSYSLSLSFSSCASTSHDPIFKLSRIKFETSFTCVCLFVDACAGLSDWIFFSSSLCWLWHVMIAKGLLIRITIHFSILIPLLYLLSLPEQFRILKDPQDLNQDLRVKNRWIATPR